MVRWKYFILLRSLLNVLWWKFIFIPFFVTLWSPYRPHTLFEMKPYLFTFLLDLFFHHHPLHASLAGMVTLPSLFFLLCTHFQWWIHSRCIKYFWHPWDLWKGNQNDNKCSKIHTLYYKYGRTRNTNIHLSFYFQFKNHWCT